jgi:hypothetical protein
VFETVSQQNRFVYILGEENPLEKLKSSRSNRDRTRLPISLLPVTAEEREESVHAYASKDC